MSSRGGGPEGLPVRADGQGNRGTDQGHANAMFVLRGPVKGGTLSREWPGLQRE